MCLLVLVGCDQDTGDGGGEPDASNSDVDSAKPPQDAPDAGDDPAPMPEPDGSSPLGQCAGKPAGVVCRAASGPCDAAEVCDGQSDECPVDGRLGADHVCRPSAGACDLPESCDGFDAGCPDDSLLEAGVVCRPAKGVCDVEEACTGVAPSCPDDTVAEADVVCREGTGACDPDELCDGKAPGCPVDTVLQPGESCDDGLFCNGPDTCNNRGECVHAGDPCAEAGDGDKDCRESCNEVNRDCSAPDRDGTTCVPRQCGSAICSAGRCVTLVDCPVFVDPGGRDDTACGDAWGVNACASVAQAALRAIELEADEVWVRQGTYPPTDAGEPVLTMVEDVDFYGGFRGYEEQLSERGDVTETRSVLSGRMESGTEATRSEHVVIGADQASLDGFVITGGRGANGAGMLNASVSDLTVRNTAFVDNEGEAEGLDALGAGMYNINVSGLSLENVSFERNVLLTGQQCRGAGLYNSESRLMLNNVSFLDNRIETACETGEGAGLYEFDSESVLAGVRFEGQRIDSSTGNGGGFMCQDSYTEMRDVEFTDNQLVGDGRGSAMAAKGVTDVLVTDTRFERNVARGASGGTFALSDDASLEMERASFVDNVVETQGADAHGSGLWVDEGYFEVSDAQFIGNRCIAPDGYEAAGTIYAERTLAAVVGADFLRNEVAGDVARGTGVVCGQACETYLESVSFVDNQALGTTEAKGAVAHVRDEGLLFLGHATLVDNRSVSDGIRGAGGVHGEPGTLTAYGNVVLHGNEPTALQAPVEFAEFICAEEDPGVTLQGTFAPFAGPGTGIVRSPSGQVFLSPTGACVDAGDDELADRIYVSGWETLTTDIAGRPDQATVDVGRHYGEGDLWVVSFQAVDSQTIEWQVRGPDDTQCTLLADGVVQPTSQFDQSVGRYTHGEPAGTQFTLRCRSGVFVTEARLP